MQKYSHINFLHRAQGMRSRDFLKDYDQLFFNLMYQWEHNKSNNEVTDTLFQSANAYSIERAILLDENVHHFFLETPELFDFLASCPIKENRQVLTYVRENGFRGVTQIHLPSYYDMVEATKSVKLPEKNTETYYGVIHHMRVNSPSIKFAIYFFDNITSDDTVTTSIFIDDGKTSSLDDISTGELDATYEDVLSKGESINRRIVWNLLMYTLCFSENTVAGFPTDLNRDEIFQAKLTQKNSTTLTIREEFLDKETRVISPHVRGGYFKTLTSEFFVHKRGQIIYVNPTFIVGKSATTVIENDEVEHEGK